MENIVVRYRNVTILVAVLFAQVLGLAVQVQRSSENQSTRLIRVWALDLVTPLEKAMVGLQTGTAGVWHNYLYLRGVRQENRNLKGEIQRLRLEQVRMQEDAEQARRLQLLLGFKEQFISRTVAAQVIGSSGSQQSRSIYIDKGTLDGVDRDMAVITADGVVGKVLRVFNSTSQVLLIDDQTSGVGTILENSRLQGVLRGTSGGDIVLEKVMNDEHVTVGEKVLTSGGDQIFPKGLLVGRVGSSIRGPESFLRIQVLPAADLSRLEEVLVITKNEEKEPSLAADAAPLRGVDILAGRLSAVPGKPTLEQVPAGNGASLESGGGGAARPGAGASREANNSSLGKPISKPARTPQPAGARTPPPSPSPSQSPSVPPQ